MTILAAAYADFATETAMRLTKCYSHLLVSRTFSKAYSLCFQRIGYFVGHPVLIEALDKIRDSYNVNGLGQAAALATRSDIDHYRKQFERIVELRAKTTDSLEALGFEVIPSQTNFIFARPTGLIAADWFQQLRKRNILTRWFDSPKVRSWLRVTIGTETEMRKFLAATQAIRLANSPT